MNHLPFGSGLRGPLAAIAFGLAGLSLPAASTPETSGEVVQLPDVTVNGQRMLPPPESWQYGRLEDGTEVLSNASVGASKRMLHDFQMFQQALSVAWPELSGNNLPVARTLILCGRREKFDDFAAPSSGRPDLGSTSIFARNREQTAIVVDLQATSLNLSGLDDAATSTITNFEVDPYKQLYREYVRYLLSQANSRPPPWLQEGIAQIVMAMQFTPDWVKLGEIEPTPQTMAPAAGAPPADDPSAEDVVAETTVGDRPFNAVLQYRALIPLDKFFAVTADAPEAMNPLGNNRWAKQAYAFVHLCLYGENQRYKPAFDLFTKRLNTEPVSEALFKECFKMSYKQMTDELRGYIGYTFHKTDIRKLKADSPRFGSAPIVLREATQSEVGRIKGDAQRLAGRLTDALASYNDAYVRGEREPVLLAAYGVAASEDGQADRARPLLETAVKAPGVRRPSVYVELARQRLAAAKAKPAAANGRLDAAQVNSVIEALMPARRVPPPLPETYETAGELWLASAGLPPKDHLTVLMEGMKLFPHDAALYYALAEIYHRAGDSSTAAKIAQAGLSLGTDPAGKARLEQLLASLPPPAAGTRQP